MYNIEETEALIWAQVNEREAKITTATHRIVDTYLVVYIPEGEYIKAGLRKGDEKAVARRRKLTDEETEHDKLKHNSYLTAARPE